MNFRSTPECVRSIGRAFGLVALGLSSLLSHSSAAAIRDITDKFSILLCRSSDSAAPQNMAYWRGFLADRTAGGVASYWWETSLGTYDLGRSDLRGWYVVPKTTAEWRALGSTSAKIKACIDAAAADTTNAYSIPSGNRVLVISHPGVGTQASGNSALVGSDANTGTIAHEAGHALGLVHSYSNDFGYLNAWWAERGEYDDPWDAMSWALGFPVATPFGAAPAWLSGPTLDSLGWLPRSRVITAGSDGKRSATYTLAALTHPEVSGALMLRVPFDIEDPQHYFAIEFRQRDSWDASLPADAVLIHEVTKVYDTGGNYKGHAPRLYRDLTRSDKPPLDAVIMPGLIIRTINIDPAAHTAQVSVVNEFVQRCQQPYVWREITAGDLVCVTKADRAAIKLENQNSASNMLPDGGCKQGFAWREAQPPDILNDYGGDLVCVSQAVRDREQANNAAHANRTNPSRLTYGPNTCKPGLVWREVDEWDYVCVTPQERTMVQQQNQAGPARTSPSGGAFGPDTCLPGFVWRDAFVGDHVCVTGNERTLAAVQNSVRQQRWITP